jgi:hypothetical protein
MKEVPDAVFSSTRMHFPSNEIIKVVESVVNPLMLDDHIMQDNTSHHDPPPMFLIPKLS